MYDVSIIFISGVLRTFRCDRFDQKSGNWQKNPYEFWIMTWLLTKQLTPNLVLVLLMSVYQNSESIQAVISFLFESFSKTENL